MSKANDPVIYLSRIYRHGCSKSSMPQHMLGCSWSCRWSCRRLHHPMNHRVADSGWSSQRSMGTVAHHPHLGSWEGLPLLCHRLKWWSHPLRLTSMLFWWHKPCFPFLLVHPFVQNVHQLSVPVLFQTPSMAICLLARALSIRHAWDRCKHAWSTRKSIKGKHARQSITIMFIVSTIYRSPYMD